MSDAVLRAIIRAGVGGLVRLFVLAWRYFRSRSRRGRWAILLSILAAGALVAAYAVARHQLRKRVQPWGPEHYAPVTAFLGEQRARIEEAGRRLDALAAMVAGGDWLPEGELAAEAPARASLLLWAAQLRDGDLRGLDPPAGELDDLRELLGWARHPETIRETYLDQPLDLYAEALDRACGPFVAVGELADVALPELTDVRFDRGGKVSGTFRPGRVRFRVAIVEAGSLRIVAHGEGEARSSDRVRITADAKVLNHDLWSATERAAWDVARGLAGD